MELSETVLWIQIRKFWGPPDPDQSLLCTDPDHSINKQKKVRKNFFLLLCDFFCLSAKTEVNVPSKSNKQRSLEKILIFVGILSDTDEKCGIRIRK